MRTLPRLRSAASIAIGAAVGVAAWNRVAPIDPYLEVRVVAAADETDAPRWDVTLIARGDEPIEGVRVASARGGTRVEGSAVIARLARGERATITVRADPGTAAADCVVHVIQDLPTSRTYEVGLPPRP